MDSRKVFTEIDMAAITVPACEAAGSGLECLQTRLHRPPLTDLRSWTGPCCAGWHPETPGGRPQSPGGLSDVACSRSVQSWMGLPPALHSNSQGLMLYLLQRAPSVREQILQSALHDRFSERLTLASAGKWQQLGRKAKGWGGRGGGGGGGGVEELLKHPSASNYLSLLYRSCHDRHTSAGGVCPEEATILYNLVKQCTHVRKPENPGKAPEEEVPAEGNQSGAPAIWGCKDLAVSSHMAQPVTLHQPSPVRVQATLRAHVKSDS